MLKDVLGLVGAIALELEKQKMWDLSTMAHKSISLLEEANQRIAATQGTINNILSTAEVVTHTVEAIQDEVKGV